MGGCRLVQLIKRCFVDHLIQGVKKKKKKGHHSLPVSPESFRDRDVEQDGRQINGGEIDVDS